MEGKPNKNTQAWQVLPPLYWGKGGGRKGGETQGEGERHRERGEGGRETGQDS